MTNSRLIYFNLQSVVAKGLLTDISEKANYVSIMMNFSAQTSSQRTQEMIEVKLEKKRKNILGLYWYIELNFVFRSGYYMNRTQDSKARKKRCIRDQEGCNNDVSVLHKEQRQECQSILYVLCHRK